MIFEDVYDKHEIIRDASRPTLVNNDVNNNTLNNMIHDKTEQFIREKLKVNIEWMLLIRLIIVLSLIVAFLNSIIYSSMVEIVLYLLTLGVVSTNRINSQGQYYSSILIQLSFGLILYDICNFILHTGSNQMIGFYVNFLTILNFIDFGLKIILLISSVIIKVKIEKAVQASLNKNDI